MVEPKPLEFFMGIVQANMYLRLLFMQNQLQRPLTVDEIADFKLAAMDELSGYCRKALEKEDQRQNEDFRKKGKNGTLLF